MKESENSDILKFAIAVRDYFIAVKECNRDECKDLFLALQSKIKDLTCEDFRLYFLKACHQNDIGEMNKAKENIDKSIELVHSVKEINMFGEIIRPNGFMLLAPSFQNDDFVIIEGMNYSHNLVGNIYNLAGTIYAKIGKQGESFEYYKKSLYYHSFFKSEFDEENFVKVLSFRKYNQFSLADLINNEITVSSSTCMNDPFDSVINLWSDEKNLSQTCTEPRHIKPMHDAFGLYRIRSFCMENGNKSVKNILMWSHYADEHKGFCIKYKLSRHFIKQEENEDGQHMFLKKIIYKNIKLNPKIKSIDSNIAFATKRKDWKYENEVRLIVYDTKREDSHYGIPLDEDSEIEAIFFGYLCPKSTIKTIQNTFVKRGTNPPKFYKMVIDPMNVYNLQMKECPLIY